MKKILFLTKGHQASSTRDRALIYSDLLRADKFFLTHLGLSKNLINYVKALLFAPYYDIIFLQRKLLSFPYFLILRLLAKKIIYDFDDAIFLNKMGEVSKSRLLRFSLICKKSDCIFAGNNYLKKNAKKYNKNIYMIPTCLDTKKYIVKHNKSNYFFDLVWIGSKSTSKYLIEIIPELEKANLKLKNLRILNISDVSLESELIPIKNIKWSEKSQYENIKSAHIGLAPLDKSNWSKGKCAFKVLQYASAGLPIISSNFGVNKTLIEDYNVGLLVKNKKDWLKNIEFIKNNKAAYKKFSINAYKMSRLYDLEANYKKIKKIILHKN